MKAVYLYEEIPIPEKVSVSVEGKTIKVKGPKGEVIKDFSHIRGIEIRTPLLSYYDPPLKSFT